MLLVLVIVAGIIGIVFGIALIPGKGVLGSGWVSSSTFCPRIIETIPIKIPPKADDKSSIHEAIKKRYPKRYPKRCLEKIPKIKFLSKQNFPAPESPGLDSRLPGLLGLQSPLGHPGTFLPTNLYNPYPPVAS